ncbi:protein S-acyltransferase 11-like [Wolffia australiana]
MGDLAIEEEASTPRNAGNPTAVVLLDGGDCGIAFVYPSCSSSCSSSLMAGGGLWVFLPIVYSISYLCGTIQFIVAGVLSICTVSTFLLASLSSPGAPACSSWGDYTAVSKGSLEDFNFCSYCSRPKPPRAHHCRSCGMCVMDMDHHCPFIGNCVGGGNHRYFVVFLISAVVSCLYITAMSAFAWYMAWPPLDPERMAYYYSLEESSESTNFFKQVVSSMVNSVLVLSPRSLLVLYLGISSLSILIGVSALLSQQLRLIYDGQTYLTQLTSGIPVEKGRHNIQRFFAFPEWPYGSILVSFFHGKLLARSSYSKHL